MGMMDDLLKKYNANLDDLNPDEMSSLFKMLQAAEGNELDIPKITVYLRDLISTLEKELINTDEWERYFFGLFKRENRKQIFLKAKLDSYIVLEGLVTSPERARRAMEELFARLGKKVA